MHKILNNCSTCVYLAVVKYGDLEKDIFCVGSDTCLDDPFDVKECIKHTLPESVDYKGLRNAKTVIYDLLDLSF